jgi:hypothetical protein
VSGQSNVVADTTTDTLTLVAGANVTITTDAATDSITISAAGGGGSGSPGGSNTQVQYNSSGAFAGATNVTIDNNDLTLGVNASPITPAASNVKLFGRNLGGRILPAFIGPSGLDSAIQPHIARNKVAIWNPPGNSNNVPGVFGFAAVTAVGTATTRNVATTSFGTRMRRLGYVSAATAGSLAGHTANAAQWTVGTGGSPAFGGFHFMVRFMQSDAAAVSGARMFVGMHVGTTAPTNVEPNTLVNCIGVAQLTTTSNLSLVYGGSAAQPAIDLGANFPATSANEPFELTLFSPPGLNNTVYYRVERLATGAIAEGTLTAATPGTQLPSSTTLLGYRAWRCNNATALAVGIDIAHVYIETDY